MIQNLTPLLLDCFLSNENLTIDDIEVTLPQTGTFNLEYDIEQVNIIEGTNLGEGNFLFCIDSTGYVVVPQEHSYIDLEENFIQFDLNNGLLGINIKFNYINRGDINE